MAKTNTTTPTPKPSRPVMNPELVRLTAPGGGKGVRPAPSTATKFGTPMPKK